MSHWRVKMRKNFSNQKEKVGSRVQIGWRPPSRIYNALVKRSKKEGISLNMILTNLIEGSNLLA